MSTPAGQNEVVRMDRLSTGGTRHEAHYQRPLSGPMSDQQRSAKTRARTTLFPDRAAAARETDAGRKAVVRAADRADREQVARLAADREQVARPQWQVIVAGWRAEIDGTLPPDINLEKLEAQRRYLDEGYARDGIAADVRHLDGEPDGSDGCDQCDAELQLIWLEHDWYWCDRCLAWLHKGKLRFGCASCDFDLCHRCSWRVPDWSNKDLAEAPERSERKEAGIYDDGIDGAAQYHATGTTESVEMLRAALEAEYAGMRAQGLLSFPTEPMMIDASGSRALVIDFAHSDRARSAAQLLRRAGLSCRTLFSNSQLTDSCGYNSAKWACMLRELGSEHFYEFTREQASVVLQPSFIAEQNVKLGYGHSTDAQRLGSRRILKLATLDNPDGAGVAPWWLSCPAYDHFLEALQSTISHADHYRRGGLEINVVNTDCAGGSGHHWFVVAWVIV